MSRPERPRPLADAPVDELVTGAETIARDWLVRMIELGPIGDAPSAASPEFVAGAPALVAAVARALAGDEALAGLGTADLAPLAVAGSPSQVVARAEALRQAIAAAAAVQLQAPSAAQASDLAQRLAHACSLLAQHALAASAAVPAAASPVEALAQALAQPGPVAAIVLEIDDAERLAAVDPELAELAAAALGERMRAAVGADAPAGTLAPGCDWAVLRVDEAEAQRIGASIATAVEHGLGGRVRIAAGTASRPPGADDAETLLATAQERALAARAAGLRSVG